ncbi:NAD(P)-dependent oxidoreductase [Cryptosporangium aurantiacum]|uniref:D-3-phosphoglycerate dehydrogenase n=1 Tax=Cryptosporangium aurantiacum TaxID=134849 RepID=A0A1M7RMZ4_9ACTN|nr:NAD(P)-dependent oxidoreductase [Cryptosporangium aurantiacum]SHN47436.1 D-3-phosphoglycerate dehydrogenase [Cryptosporangium aurantiacum]
MITVVVGDQFIPAAHYVEALGDGLDVRTATWAGAKGEQHALQQVMEQDGPNGVPPPAELLAAVEPAEALCLHFAPVSAALIAAAPKLRLIAVARSGLENVDVEAATAAGVGVVPAHGRNAGAVAELQLALMLAEARDVARADASVKTGGWRKEFPGTRVELAGRTVGMVGFGHVGRVFAQRVAGFGCRLLAYDPYTPDAALAASGVERAADLDHVFADGDFVLVQARLTPETSRFIGEAQFRLMKPTAYFVNVSRSRLVDSSALYSALAAGRIAGAGLDVFDSEPLPADSPWRTLDNVTITTHFGGDTEDTNRTSTRLVAEAVAELATTGRVARAVNAAALGW